MKKLGLAFLLTVMATAGASAQGVEFRIGPDADRSWDRGSRERVIVRERRGRDWDEDRRVRRREVETTGTVGCRTTTVRRENRRGEMVTQRIRECD